MVFCGGLSDCEELLIMFVRVSDCEELVGVFTGDGEVGLVKKYNIRVHRLCVLALRACEANNQVSV